MNRQVCWSTILALFLVTLAGTAGAHEISGDNARFVGGISGPAPIPFLYLGAKHMVTGLDHILFLIGVVFFLRRLRDVVIYVSLFTAGHSLTLLAGVLGGFTVNAYIIDAIIGLSVVYKAFENMGGFDKVIKIRLNMKFAVFAFGLAHGLGLATKLQSLSVSEDGLVTNILSFNLGVEIGQVMVLVAAVGILNVWRERPSFATRALVTNTALMAGGFILTGTQITGYLVS